MKNKIVNAYLTVDECNDIVSGIKENMYLPFYGNINVQKLSEHANVYLLKCNLDGIVINISFAIKVGMQLEIKVIIKQLTRDIMNMYKFELKHKKEVK